MTHDTKTLLARAFRAGWESHDRHVHDAGTVWHLEKSVAAYLARYEFDDEETRRLVEGAMRVER